MIFKELNMIELKDLHKVYKTKDGQKVEALKGITVTLPDRGLVFILGKSGSGKSTFLNVVGGLDTFDSGDLILFGKSSKSFNSTDFNAYRNKYIGFIFQEYNIINSFTVHDNVSLAYELKYGKNNEDKVQEILKKVGIAELSNRKPSEISGGQKQRVAIARALVKHPRVILADEPTGALDGTTSRDIFDLLKKLSKTCLVVCVTHDASCAETYADRIIRLKNGLIVDDITRHLSEGEVLDGSTVLHKVGEGLIKIDSIKNMTDKDLSVLNEASSSYDGPSYITYKDKVRFPVDLMANDDSMDLPVGFSKTNKDDIEKNINPDIKYNSKNGRIPFTTILKMAMSSLKSGWVRLVFTFILSIISFTFFGLALEVSTYDASDTYASSADIYRTDAITLYKQVFKEDNTESTVYMSDEDYNNIKDSYKGAIPAYRTLNINIKKSIPQDKIDSLPSYLKLSTYFISPLDDLSQIEAYKDFSLVDGSKAPSATDEIVLTDYFLTMFNETGYYDYTDSASGTLVEKGCFNSENLYKNILGKKIKIYQSFDTDPLDESETIYKVVGVVKTDLNKEDIETAMNNLEAEDNSKDKIIQSYVDFSSSTDGRSTGMETTVFFSPSAFSANNIKKYDIQGEKDGINLISRVYVPTNSKDEIKQVYSFSKSKHNLTVKADTYYIQRSYIQKSYTINSYIASKLDSSFLGTITGISTYAMYIAIGIGIIAVLTTMNFIFTSVAFKKQDIGILKGLGSTSRDVFAIFVIESLLIAAVNFILSFAITWSLTPTLNALLVSLMGMSPLSMLSFNWIQGMVLFVLSFGTAILSALIPSYSIANMKPVDAMKRNE